MTAARPRHALVLSVHPSLRRRVAARLVARGFSVDTAERIDPALPASRRPDLVVTDDVPSWKAHVATKPAPALLLLVAGSEGLAEAARALESGAGAILPVALADEEIAGAVAASLVARRERAKPAAEHLVDARFLGASPAAREARRQARAAATTDETVLVLGEAGTGKKLLVECLARTARPDGPLLTLAVEALPPEDHASALLGSGDDEGLLAWCAGGSLILSEVHALSPGARSALLEHLEARARGEGPDVRILATSSADLPRLVADGAFDRALYYRLSTIAIHLVPLRLRPTDVPLLASAFALRASTRIGKPIRRVGAETLRALRARSWPGNVAELESLIERAVALAPGLALLPKHLEDAERLAPLPRAAMRPVPVRGGLLRAVESASAARAAEAVPALLTAPANGEDDARSSDFFDLPYPEAKERMLLAFELDYVRSALARANGSVGEAARLAGVDRANFRRLAKRALKRAAR